SVEQIPRSGQMSENLEIILIVVGILTSFGCSALMILLTRTYSRTRQKKTEDILAEFDSKFKNEFLIKQILGVGSFGIVFEVTNRLDKMKYAVKRIPVEPNAEKLIIQTEVKAMFKFDHPGIVRYINMWIEKPPQGWQVETDLDMLKLVGSTNKHYKINYLYNSSFIYIQMELCKYSLAEWLQENNTSSTRSLSRIKRWFKQLLCAVAYIHNIGMIHRDLKPANILFVEDDRVKICDLGLATERWKEGGSQTALTRTHVGTELYMSPENRQLHAKYSSKTDVFALGLILAELCAVMTYVERTKV
ncbi:hypothetical protein PMAYCL1PPCAC_19503, partial [Pristionchus mayeri]